MALFSKRSRTKGVSDPAKLLVTEHEKVERLFAEIERTQSASRRNGLVAQLDADLSAHMAAEERLLYPVLRAEVPDGAALADRAEKEHAEAKQVLGNLIHTDPGDASFTKTVKSLKKLIAAHVKEEEKRILPKLASALDGARLGELRGALEQAKFADPVVRPLDEPATQPAADDLAVEADVEIVVEVEPAPEPVPEPEPEPAPAASSSNGARAVLVQSHNDQKRWQVKRDGASRASKVFDTQKEAEQYGRSVAKRERVELVVHGRDGNVRKRDSYAD
jgi:hemerythrin superfamily protein